MHLSVHVRASHLAEEGGRCCRINTCVLSDEHAQVRHNLMRTTGWEAVMRIRCSKGLRISAFHGHFFIRSTDLLALPQARSLLLHTASLNLLELVRQACCVCSWS